MALAFLDFYVSGVRGLIFLEKSCIIYIANKGILTKFEFDNYGHRL